MKEQIKENIIDTLSYFDLFGYPLTLDQIHLFLHNGSTPKKLLKEYVEEIPVVEKYKGLYFFTERKKFALRRKIRERVNKEKTLLGIHYSNLLGKLPGVKLVALTGSVSMLNASKDDDIDVFIITKKNTLWTTRMLVVMFTKVLGIKREYKSRQNSDKICLNMFLDESEMEMAERNLYSAHEIVQMKAYLDKNHTYKKFVNKNSWIKEYFPNLYIRENRKNKRSPEKKQGEFRQRLESGLNLIAFAVQYLYMRKKIGTEKIGLKKAFFHTKNTGQFIVNEHKKRTKYYTDLNSKLSVIGDFKHKFRYGPKGRVN